jgi:hypothetical protein
MFSSSAANVGCVAAAGCLAQPDICGASALGSEFFYAPIAADFEYLCMLLHDIVASNIVYITGGIRAVLHLLLFRRTRPAGSIDNWFEAKSSEEEDTCCQNTAKTFGAKHCHGIYLSFLPHRLTTRLLFGFT